MPFYREVLLSAWPEDLIFEVGHLPGKIDAEVLKNMLPATVGYRAANPRTGLRNQVERTRFAHPNGTALAAPRFLSQKARDAQHVRNEHQRMSDAAEAFSNLSLVGSTKAEVPVIYRNVEIKYSRFGVNDFDFQ